MNEFEKSLVNRLTILESKIKRLEESIEAKDATICSQRQLLFDLEAELYEKNNQVDSC